MDFWKKAQAAAEKLISSEAAAEVARIAQQAAQQAAALAKEATDKAQEVAKEAVAEAQKSLSYIGNTAEAQDSSATPLQYGITPALEQFVRSLTYSTFSDYPLDSLDVPTQPEQQKLNPWQEIHARLLLDKVPQLQDLRFVLCPKRMDEYIFWMIYFTLSRRYLPEQPQHEQSTTAGESSHGQAAASSNRPQSSLAMDRQQHTQDGSSGSRAEEGGEQQSLVAQGEAAAVAVASDGWRAEGDDDEDADDVDVDAELAALADDPELDAYLQDALQLGGVAAEDDEDVDGGLAGDGDDLDDLDDYVQQLDAEAQKS